jgi:hypothetical protein
MLELCKTLNMKAVLSENPARNAMAEISPPVRPGNSTPVALLAVVNGVECKAVQTARDAQDARFLQALAPRYFETRHTPGD